MLKKNVELANEMSAAISDYFVVYANKEKENGWCGRIEFARSRINKSIKNWTNRAQ